MEIQLRGVHVAAHAEQAVAPEVKPDPEAKLKQAEVESEPEIKQEPFTIRGHFGLDRIRPSKFTISWSSTERTLTET